MYTNALPGCTPMYINADNACDEILEFLDEMGEICNSPFVGSHFFGDA